jgi:hypothetical protein
MSLAESTPGLNANSPALPFMSAPFRSAGRSAGRTGGELQAQSGTIVVSRGI